VARAASRRYAALGITAIQDAAVTPAMARRYADARAAGALAIEVGEVMVGARAGSSGPTTRPRPPQDLRDGGYRCACASCATGRRDQRLLFYTREELTALLSPRGRDRTVGVSRDRNLGIETVVGAIEDAVQTMPEAARASASTTRSSHRRADRAHRRPRRVVVAQRRFSGTARRAGADRATDATIRLGRSRARSAPA